MRTSSTTAALWFTLLALFGVTASVKYIDISHEYVPTLPKYDSLFGLGMFTTISSSILYGNEFNTRLFRLSTDCGTHVEAYIDVESLNLTILNGPVLVVEVPHDTNITAEVMQSLNIHKGVKRVIFRTGNTERKLMYKTVFDSSYTGFQKDAAAWLRDNTDIKLIGIDYLAVGVKPDKADVYKIFSKDVIPMEGLKLDEVEPGEYFLHCLPLRMSTAKAAPTRCILVY